MHAWWQFIHHLHTFIELRLHFSCIIIERDKISLQLSNSKWSWAGVWRRARVTIFTLGKKTCWGTRNYCIIYCMHPRILQKSFQYNIFSCNLSAVVLWLSKWHISKNLNLILRYIISAISHCTVFSIIQNELMSPALSKNTVLSRLTLAVFEDSGYAVFIKSLKYNSNLL